ncbi:MAG: M28 family metallopeptidase [Acidobacteriota bacterium]
MIEKALSAAVALLLLGLAGCSGEKRPAAGGPQADRIRAHLERLASDEMEGRAPGTPGGDRAAAYIAEQFAACGLEPLGKDGFLQPVPMVGTSVEGKPLLSLQTPAGKRELSWYEDVVVTAGPAEADVDLQLRDLPIVFAGYGIVDPTTGWNDYAGIDMKGKVALVFVNDPPSDDPAFFGGRALTYFGRWTYKIEEAARQGAAGILIIHNTEMAGYPWSVVQSSWSGEQFYLPEQVEEQTPFAGWITQGAAEALFQAEGTSWDEALAEAGRAGFQPRELRTKVSGDVRARVRRIESPNVLGLVRGSDPELAEEYIVLTSHYDHLGVGPAVDGDNIYNGALDNASGTALLIELARVLAAQREELGRSVIFAAVTGEEQGLLGSRYLGEHPPVPLERIVADINFDGINVWGETENMVAMGAEKSTLEAVVREVLGEMQIELSPDEFPEKGYFFRSDHFSFVRKGVPVIYYDSGLRFRGKPEDWGRNLMETYIQRHYHQPSDEYDPQWSLEGAVQLGEVVRRTVLRIAKAPERPQWKPGEPAKSGILLGTGD